MYQAIRHATNRRVALAIGLCIALAGAVCAASAGDFSQPNPKPEPSVPDSPKDVNPLGEGKKVPDVKVYNLEGKKVALRDVLGNSPTVLIFYRGGWCPFCNAHLGQLAKAQKDLLDEGFKIVAISPDKSEFPKGEAKKKNLKYTILSDPEVAAIRAFGLAFRVDEETLERYKTYNVDLEKRSGHRHHILPVPAAYLVDGKGMIRFAHWNADYKKRIDPEKLLKIAKEISGSSPASGGK